MCYWARSKMLASTPTPRKMHAEKQNMSDICKNMSIICKNMSKIYKNISKKVGLKSAKNIKKMQKQLGVASSCFQIIESMRNQSRLIDVIVNITVTRFTCSTKMHSSENKNTKQYENIISKTDHKRTCAGVSGPQYLFLSE